VALGQTALRVQFGILHPEELYFSLELVYLNP
jgi:hypothetical protein